MDRKAELGNLVHGGASAAKTGYELAKNFNITYQVYLKSIIC